jgi:heme-binding uptake protein ChaN (Tiki superfamily)
MDTLVLAMMLVFPGTSAIGQIAQRDPAFSGSPESAGAPDLPPGTDPEPVRAVDAVIDALGRSPVVALGESHNVVQAGRLYAQLARSETFSSLADAIVVEFGNARYQRVVDRYVLGRNVRSSELHKAWQDTTQVGAWDAPMYRRLFAAVRAANADRSPSLRIRILLGDPPINWSRVSSERDVRRFLLRRERFMARVIEQKVIAKGNRAVVIAGLAHVQRSASAVEHPNVTQILDRRDPNSVWVIGVHLGFPLQVWEQALSDWPTPSVATLEDTWIGLLPKADALAQDALDAMLYLGAPESLRLSIPLPSVYRHDAYWEALKDRWSFGIGGPFSAKALFGQYQGAGYPGVFSTGSALREEIANLHEFAECMRAHAVEAFPDPQFQYDAVGFYGSAIEEARSDPDYAAAFQACSQLLVGEVKRI